MVRTCKFISVVGLTVVTSLSLYAVPPLEVLMAPWTTPDDFEKLEERDIATLCNARLRYAQQKLSGTPDQVFIKRLLRLCDILNIARMHFSHEAEGIMAEYDERLRGIERPITRGPFDEEAAVCATQLGAAFKRTISGVDDNGLARVVHEAVDLVCDEAHRVRLSDEDIREDIEQLNWDMDGDTKEMIVDAVCRYWRVRSFPGSRVLLVSNSELQNAQVIEKTCNAITLAAPVVGAYCCGPIGCIVGSMMLAAMINMYGETGRGVTDGLPGWQAVSPDWWNIFFWEAERQSERRAAASYGPLVSASERWSSIKNYLEKCQASNSLRLHDE